MGEKEFILTQEGYDNLEKELERLKTVERYEIAERIKVALGFGDLSENSEYDEAKSAQELNENKITMQIEIIALETAKTGIPISLKLYPKHDAIKLPAGYRAVSVNSKNIKKDITFFM
mgnify:CR=1 FL=1